jgi:hypothetical protein
VHLVHAESAEELARELAVHLLAGLGFESSEGQALNSCKRV